MCVCCQVREGAAELARRTRDCEAYRQQRDQLAHQLQVRRTQTSDIREKHIGHLDARVGVSVEGDVVLDS